MADYVQKLLLTDPANFTNLQVGGGYINDNFAAIFNAMSIDTTSFNWTLASEVVGGCKSIKVRNNDNANTLTQTSGIFFSPDSRSAEYVGFEAYKTTADYSTGGGRDSGIKGYVGANNSQKEWLDVNHAGDAAFAGTIFGNGDLTLNNESAEIHVGLGSAPVAGEGGVYMNFNGLIRQSSKVTTTSSMIEFYNASGQAGKITISGVTTSYLTSSDYRLKDNVIPMVNAGDRLMQLKPCTFNFTADPTTVVDGFLAHEAQAVVPEAVSGEKDAMQEVFVVEAVEAVAAQDATYDDDGNELTPAIAAVEAVAEVIETQPNYQGIDQSKLVPLLVGALQEALTRIEALENPTP